MMDSARFSDFESQPHNLENLCALQEAIYYTTNQTDNPRIEKPPYSIFSKISLVVLSIFSVATEGVSVPVSLKSRYIPYTTAAASLLAWGMLNAFGSVWLIRSITKPESELEKEITRAQTHICIRVATVAAVIILGVASLVPYGQPIWEANTEVSPVLRLLLIGAKLLGAFGFPSYSLYLLQKDLKTQRNPVTMLLCCAPNEFEAELNKIKDQLISALDFQIAKSVSWTTEEKESTLLMYYLKIQRDYIPTKQIDTLFKNALNEFEASQASRSCCARGFRHLTRYTAMLCAVTIIYQNVILGKDGIQHFTNSIPLIVALCILVVGPAAYLNITMPGNAAERLYDKAHGAVNSEIPQSFGETFYPVTTRLLQLLGLALSVLTFGQGMVYLDKVFNWDSKVGKAFTIVNLSALILQLIDMLSETIDGAVESAASSYGSDKVKSVCRARENLNEIRALIKESNPLEFASFLDGIEDEELKNKLLGQGLSADEITVYLEQVGESEPLFRPVN